MVSFSWWPQVAQAEQKDLTMMPSLFCCWPEASFHSSGDDQSRELGSVVCWWKATLTLQKGAAEQASGHPLRG